MEGVKTITVMPDIGTTVIFHYNDISTVIINNEKKEYISVEIDMKNGTNWKYNMATAKCFLKQYNAIKDKESN